nr:glutamate-rich protein 1 [Nothobranchius furzeri]
MAHRNQVFQSKVLQKLYPASSILIKEHNPSPVAEAQTSTGKRKASEQDSVSGKTQDATSHLRRLYTVLPPPPDYKMHLNKSVAAPQFESVNSDEDPAGELHNSSEEVDEQNEADEPKRRKRRRKKKQISSEDSKVSKALVGESSTGPGQVSADEKGERMSSNKRRKLKKKRHKEKLLSMGLMPRATALEFTYQNHREEEDEDENKRRVAELSEFLRRTAEIYVSDSSLHPDAHLSAVVEDLLASILSGSKPPSVLKQLYGLQTLVELKKAESLEKSLIALNNSQILSAEESAAVVSLFRYWITDVLPLQRVETTRLSTA